MSLSNTSDLKPVVVSTINSFLALKSDGTLVAWGKSGVTTSSLPNDITNSGFIDIASTNNAFAALNSSGQVISWGTMLDLNDDSTDISNKTPTDTDFVRIYSNQHAFAAQKKNGKVKAWGRPGYGAPIYNSSGTDTTLGISSHFYSEVKPFKNGFYGRRIGVQTTSETYAWGKSMNQNVQSSNNSMWAGIGMVSKPGTTGAGATRSTTVINYPTKVAFNDEAVAIIYSEQPSSSETYTKNGSIAIGGASDHGGLDSTIDFNSNSAKRLYENIYSTQKAFAALNKDGSIVSWGDTDFGGTGAPTGTGYSKIYSTNSAFAALNSDGSISVWGDSSNGGSRAPTGTGFTKIFSTATAFAAIKSDGSVSVWGDSNNGGSGAPSGTGFTKIFSNETTFVGLNTDGSVTAWGGGANSEFGASGAPTSSDILTIIPSQYAFTAIKTDGSVVSWGDDSSNTYLGSASAPSDLTFVTSNFAYKMNGYEMSRWSAIHEINNVEHDLNKVTYYRNAKVSLYHIISNNKIANAKLIEGKIGIEHINIDSSLTYSFQKSINQSDFTDVDVSKLLRFSGNADSKKGYYFDISGAQGTNTNLAGMFKLRVIATIDNIKYAREFVYNSSTLPTSTAYDLSNKSVTRSNGNTFNITNLDSNVDKYMTALVSSNNRDWVWFKPSSNRAAFQTFNIGTQHPLGESYFKMTLGEKYYVKIGLTKGTSTNVNFNTYKFFDTIEFYYIPNTQFNFTASLTKGNTFMTLNLTQDNSFKDYIKEMQIQFYEDSNDIETFTIPKSKTSYTFNNLTNGTTYYVKISPIDLNNKVNIKEISLNATPNLTWLPEVDMKTDSNYEVSTNETDYYQTIYVDNNYIQYWRATSKTIKILKKSGTSWNQVTDPFPSDNLPNFTQSRITHFHKSGNYFAYYEQPSNTSQAGNIVVYKQGSDGKMTFISRVTTGFKHTPDNIYQKYFHSFTMNEDNGTVTIYRNLGKNSKLDAGYNTKKRIVYPASQAESDWTEYAHHKFKYLDANGIEQEAVGHIYYDYNKNFILFSSNVYFKKNGEKSVSFGSKTFFSNNRKVYVTKNFILVATPESNKRWGWINFNRSPISDGEWTTSKKTGAYKFASNTSTSAGFIDNQITNVNGGIIAFGSKYLMLPGNSSRFGKIINYSDNSEFPVIPSSSFRFNNYSPSPYYAKTIANDFYIISSNGKVLGTDSPPTTASDEAISNGISESDVEVLEAVTFTADTEDSTKSVPAKTAIDKIKNLMSSIGRDSDLTDKQKIEKKRKQRRSTLKVLFNKSRQVKKMIIPKANLDLPTTFTKEKALVVKAGETLKLSDLADDEGAYAVLDDGEEIKYETANTVLTFTREDNALENDREEYFVSATTWRDIDGEGIVINSDNVTGTFSSDTKDGNLLTGDTFTIDGQLFFIGSVGTGESGGGSAGDPYIYPFKSNCPVKLPNKKAFYRIFEQGNNYINVEVDQATEDHKDRMLKYAKNITPVTHNIVMDGYFYSKLFISAEGHKLSVDYLTKKASCDKDDLSFFKISNSIKRFDCGEFYEDAKCVNIKWRTKENKLIKAQVLFFPNPHIENGINVIPQTLHNSTGLLVDNYKPKLMEIPRLTTEKYGKIQRKLKKSKNIHHKMGIKGKNEKWYFSK